MELVVEQEEIQVNSSALHQQTQNGCRNTGGAGGGGDTHKDTGGSGMVKCEHGTAEELLTQAVVAVRYLWFRVVVKQEVQE